MSYNDKEYSVKNYSLLVERTIKGNDYNLEVYVYNRPKQNKQKRKLKSEQILEVYSSEMTVKDIAELCKVSSSYVRSTLRGNGLIIKNKYPKGSVGDVANWASTYNNGRLRHIYYNMLKRCNDKNNKGYKYYGARGISVCSEWSENCRNFYRWAKNTGYEKGLTLDRIDNNKGYSPENCRWVTQRVNNMNRRCTLKYTFNGKKKTLKEWAEELKIDYFTLKDRLRRYNWSVERAFSVGI